MKRRLILLAAVFLAAAPASAADIRVAPVSIDVLPGSLTTTITVINEEQSPVQVQMRVMRWSQDGGQDVLTPTQDVVASPPQATLEPGEHYLVRLVRTTEAPLGAEEHYRLIVDEVPDPADAQPGAVNLVLRQEIPVFFSNDPPRVSVVDWAVEHEGGQLWLSGTNRGDRRLRLSDIVLEGNGGPLYEQSGLIGYVLPGSTMRWPLMADTDIGGDVLHLRGVSDTGEIEVFLADEARP